MIDENYHKYFAVNEDDKSWGLYVLDCGAIYEPKGANYPRRNHPDKYLFSWQQGRVLDEFQLTYIIKGNGSFESAHCGPTELQQGTIFLLYPGIWHRYKSDPGCDWRTYWIGFDGKIARNIIPKLGIMKEIPIKRVGYHDTLIDIFNNILENSKNEFSGHQQVLAGEVMKLLGWIHAITRKAVFKEVGIDSIMQDAKIMLRQPEKYVQIEHVADAMNMGYSKFRKLFKDYTGLSPGQFRMQYQIKRAMDLLSDAHLSIKEICDLLGFGSTQYFSRVFRDKTGKTPGKYGKSK